MSAAGQRLHLRLFLEGIEVPVIAAQVQANINAPATASIQVVPTDALLNLKARTMVHLFFWDYTYDLDLASIESSTDPNGNTVLVTDTRDPLKGYKLMFSGEFVGISMMKTPVGRQSVLQCADFSTYWDTTYQFMISYGPHGNFLGNSSAVWAGGASTFNDIIDGHTSVMNSYLRSRPKTPGLQDVKGLMGGIISVLEVMGGIRNQQHGVNDFFTIAELKNHIMQQIVAEQDDDTAQRLFDEKSFMEWLNRGLSSLGQLTTFRDMLKLLFQFIYYECVPNPSPKYVPGEQSKKSVKTSVLVFPPSVQNKLIEILKRISLIAGSATFDEGVLEDKGTSQQDINSAGFNLRTQAADARDDVTTAKNTKNLFPQIKAKLELAIADLDTAAKAPQGADDASLRKLFRTASNYIGEALEVGGVPRSQRFRKVETTKPKVDRLYTQIFRPDCFFAAAPKCNVFFPEIYTSFNFNRNYLQEVTRLRLTTGWIFGTTADGLLATSHFAPSTKDIRELAKKQGNDSVRALLPWEKFSGILPKFETCAEINYIAGRSERKLGIKKKNIQGKATDYAQRAANFNYFKYRFASRGCDLSMKFNPFVVVGFPAVVITQPFSPSQEQIDLAIAKLTKEKGKQFTAQDVSDNIRDVAREIGAPSHYLGMIASLSHSVSQEGGVTNVTMTHARTHRITDDDFMSLWLTEKTKDSRKRIVVTTFDAAELFGNGDYKGLQFLIDATDQSSVTTKAPQDRAMKQDQPGLANSIDLGDRPTGLPDLQDQDKLAPFVLLNPVLPNQTPGGVVIVSGQIEADDGSLLPIRGGVSESVLKGTRTKILEPSPYSAKLRPGSKGPKGGKIVQINCYSDAVISLTAGDMSKMAQVGKKTKSSNQRARVNAHVKEDQRFYLWRKIAVYEEVVDNTPIDKVIPAEEAIRPPWFTPLYSNWFIGDKIYEPFFGCGSVVDAAVFTSPNGAAAFGTSRSKQTDLLTKLKAADGDNSKIAQILDDAKSTSLADIPDVESSIDALAYIYGEVRRMGLDIHRFVHDYIYRPIATMEDIFGTADLEYSTGVQNESSDQRGSTLSKASSGNFQRTAAAKQSTFPSSNEKLILVSGTPGFHSTAIAPFGDLLGLVDNPDLELPRLRAKGKKFPISKTLDPRPERRQAVQNYQTSLEAGSGTLGIGLLG